MGCGCVSLTAGGPLWARQVMELDWSPDEPESFVTRACEPPQPGVEHESFAPRPSCGLGVVRFHCIGGLLRRAQCPVPRACADRGGPAACGRGGASSDPECRRRVTRVAGFLAARRKVRARGGE